MRELVNYSSAVTTEVFQTLLKIAYNHCKIVSTFQDFDSLKYVNEEPSCRNDIARYSMFLPTSNDSLIVIYITDVYLAIVMTKTTDY